jgi:uncharacterized protein (DUF1015 family)
MPIIAPFRGLRYDPEHIGSLDDVVAPPYDVISPELQDELHRKHPANVIRLILNRDEPGDGEGEKYLRAARYLNSWQREGVLRRDAEPALYVYHQVFQHDGRLHTRRGFMCRTRLERFGEGRIFPHEETHAAAKQDRLKLIRACQANLSQVFGLYPDQENRAQQQLEGALGQTPIQARDHLGVLHQMWTVSDRDVIAGVTATMHDKPIFIADGHHRYETACNYRDELAATGRLDPNHPAHYVLMMCVAMDDPGMIVLPTHRLFRNLPLGSSDELRGKLGDAFHVRIAGEGSDLAEVIWRQIESEGDQGTMGLYTPLDDRWLVARLTNAGRRRMAAAAADHSPDWQSLGVSILHRLIVETLLGATTPPATKYVHLVRELVENLEVADTQTEPFCLAALVTPATVAYIRAISQRGERMPAKSTYFYPKLLSGLVINPLED